MTQNKEPCFFAGQVGLSNLIGKSAMELRTTEMQDRRADGEFAEAIGVDECSASSKPCQGASEQHNCEQQWRLTHLYP